MRTSRQIFLTDWNNNLYDSVINSFTDKANRYQLMISNEMKKSIDAIVPIMKNTPEEFETNSMAIEMNSLELIEESANSLNRTQQLLFSALKLKYQWKKLSKKKKKDEKNKTNGTSVNCR